MGKGSKNELPKEVFAVLPKDPDQQLEVAQQITQIAVSGRIAKLEADCSSLRQKVAEKDAVIGGLQARVIGAETTLAETTAKLAAALEEQARLIDHKNVLTGQVKKLICQVSKLDDFKKALMKSLESSTDCDDAAGDGSKPGSSSSASSSRVTPCESLPSSPMSKSTEPPTPSKRKQICATATKGTSTVEQGNRTFLSFSTPAQAIIYRPTLLMKYEQENRKKKERKEEQGQFSCMTAEKPSPNSPSGTNKSVAPGGASEDGASSKQSPLGPLTPRPPPDSSPAKSARIAGKEFFRQARSRLTYEQFSEFLTNVKELNAHRQAKELKSAQFSTFHPKIFSCTTHVPPNCGDWVLTTPSS